uniref:SPX domain-containing protein n=1 Tax=Octactis speculum TaxID=3111310 RepID=A0A7S2D364_9STRA|mmetsp:Transcript_42407/g.57925  ORF Transcript_42407/g.57925 Transcript_42407/m.57925 type:complete len:301 (+) Transcript_42407:93-995(+)|eukprot:CAMPEP_0185770516 /NCGR_PEP_ID=MMETSP1174-20130828/59531_1 /TAXON_ID=35687 /ORGANISM="Dictyocha speculum, Strain CCMP1381" /LENGTH=300 /DNA_ID=CAMNT_0028455979 /DNA_START=93 /DNA_END=995 /DNA_ORIENTATION=-
MKFAKTLQQVVSTSDPEWAPLFMNYKYLKKRINAIKIMNNTYSNSLPQADAGIENSSSPHETSKRSITESIGERDFFKALHAELRKSSEFFRAAEQQMVIRIARIKEGARQLRETFTVTHENLDQMIMAACLKLYKDLLMLENYAIINFCGFSKILKKHDKNTGFVTRDRFMNNTVSRHEHLCKYEVLKRIIKETEDLFVEISKISHTNTKLSLQTDERISIESILNLKFQAIRFKKSVCGDEVDSAEEASTLDPPNKFSRRPEEEDANNGDTEKTEAAPKISPCEDKEPSSLFKRRRLD